MVKKDLSVVLYSHTIHCMLGKVHFSRCQNRTKAIKENKDDFAIFYLCSELGDYFEKVQ